MHKRLNFRKISAILTTVILSLFVFSTFIIQNPSLIHAQSNEELEQMLLKKQEEIKKLQEQLNEAITQEKTLKSELKKIDDQIKLTELKIEEAEFQITKLEKEITDLDGRIERLSTNVDELTKLLLSRIVSTYKYSNYDTLDLLFSANGFSDLLERLKYLQVIQANDKKVLYQLQATKATYNDQKTDKQTRQNQHEAAKVQLEKLQVELAQQKKAKDELLRITQNNEKIYQEKLRAAQREQNAILGILAGAGTETEIGSINQGNNIGNVIVGQSACSSGTHLHFEVHKDKSLQNPTTYLSNKGVNFDNSPDGSFSFSGSWDQWPVSDPIRITQGFGSTWWAQHGWYQNPPGHTGIDMVSDSNLEVKAVKSGKLFRGGIGCGGGTLYYKKIDHGDGVSSYYLHAL